MSKFVPVGVACKSRKEVEEVLKRALYSDSVDKGEDLSHWRWDLFSYWGVNLKGKTYTSDSHDVYKDNIVTIEEFRKLYPLNEEEKSPMKTDVYVKVSTQEEAFEVMKRMVANGVGVSEAPKGYKILDANHTGIFDYPFWGVSYTNKTWSRAYVTSEKVVSIEEFRELFPLDSDNTEQETRIASKEKYLYARTIDIMRELVSDFEADKPIDKVLVQSLIGDLEGLK